MKRLLLLTAILFGCVVSQAQDLITTREGEAIFAKILEVSSKEVKYKKFNNLDGPTFVLDKSDILRIKYENGEEEIVKSAQSSTLARGEVYEGMKYREYKNLYDTHFYSREMGGTYSPGWSGVASFFIPGLGQAICGEWGRGLAMFGGHLGLTFIYVAAVNAGNINYYVDGPSGVRAGNEGAYTLALTAMLADAALDVWSICDAVHIAKVKNMYYHDLRGQRAAVDIKLEPYFAYTPTRAGMYQPATGLSLRLSF